MTATFVNFAPSTSALFSFQAQLGQAQYTVSTPWNVFGQRYYVTVSDANGNVVLNTPLIACGPQVVSAFAWEDGVAQVTTSAPHNVPVGQLANVYISQTDSGFDGAYQALSTGPDTLTYPLLANPNQATPISGAVNFSRNLIAGVIAGAYLLFRYETQQFEYGSQA